MDVQDRLLDHLIVRPGTPAGIATRDPGWTGGPDFAHLAHDELEQHARDALAQGVKELSDAQELLWASDRYALLVVLQAMDAAGKDSAIEHVMRGVNPQGVQVVGFRKPSAEELDHDFLWRIAAALPERGRIGIFNRSHYEEVVALKAHPEWLERVDVLVASRRTPPRSAVGRRCASSDSGMHLQCDHLLEARPVEDADQSPRRKCCATRQRKSWCDRAPSADEVSSSSSTELHSPAILAVHRRSTWLDCGFVATAAIPYRVLVAPTRSSSGQA